MGLDLGRASLPGRLSRIEEITPSCHGRSMDVTNLLEVRGLRTQFFTPDGIVRAVNGVSYDLGEGECLAIVGESGCGKSVSFLSLMRLIPEPPGEIVAGEVRFKGRDLLKLSKEEMRRVRGAEIAMIFQEPMTSLNPVLRIGTQIVESLQAHHELGIK